MDAALGDPGRPTKLIVGNQTLFVRCEGCVEEVRKSPRTYLDKVTVTPPARGQTPLKQVAQEAILQIETVQRVHNAVRVQAKLK